MTLGILGLGAIGKAVVKRANVFGPRIIYHKRNRLTEKEENELGVEYVEFEELLAKSDILSIHVPLTEQTRRMIGREEIAKMKNGAILINLTRGGVLDESSVAEAVKEGKLSGAGLDAYEHEPVSSNNPLIGIENVILSPHVGGATKESLDRTLEMSGENMARILAGQKPKHVVNEV